MIDRIELNHPLKPNHLELECECYEGCGKLFPYIEAYTACEDWIEKHGKVSVLYDVICTECPNRRKGQLVAYADMNGVILASIYEREYVVQEADE